MTDDPSLFIKNVWYLAFHGSALKHGKLRRKELLGEQIVFGRDYEGKAFALRDNCPHRGVPLSYGWFDGKTIQCCYHGWEFNCDGTCKNIPAVAPDSDINYSKIKVFEYPIREINNTIWIYLPESKIHNLIPKTEPPALLLPPDQNFLHVESVVLPANIDHSVIGLIDPAHVSFVHQSWFWRSAKSMKLKEKRFEATPMGFKMVRHKPSSNAKGYSILNGTTSTEITFEIPGNRIEHIKVGDKNMIISITTLTPLNDHETELTHIFYSSIGLVKWLWWPLRRLGRKFIGQDLTVFMKLGEGLKSNPTLMLIGEPDAQARWYHEIKRLWQKAQQDNTPFENPVKEKILRWVT